MANQTLQTTTIREQGAPAGNKTTAYTTSATTVVPTEEVNVSVVVFAVTVIALIVAFGIIVTALLVYIRKQRKVLASRGVYYSPVATTTTPTGQPVPPKHPNSENYIPMVGDAGKFEIVNIPEYVEIFPSPKRARNHVFSWLTRTLSSDKDKGVAYVNVEGNKGMKPAQADDVTAQIVGHDPGPGDDVTAQNVGHDRGPGDDVTTQNVGRDTGPGDDVTTPNVSHDTGPAVNYGNLAWENPAKAPLEPSESVELYENV